MKKNNKNISGSLSVKLIHSFKTKTPQIYLKNLLKKYSDWKLQISQEQCIWLGSQKAEKSDLAT